MLTVRQFIAKSIALGALVFLSGATLADTNMVSITVGPIAVPAVPVMICVNGDCQSTPTMQPIVVEVSISVTDDAGSVELPTITPTACPAGTTGVAFDVLIPDNSGATTITVTVSGSLPLGPPISQTITTGDIQPGDHGALVSVCAF